MAKYIIKRILAAIPMVLIITVICFALMNLAPYDAIDAMTTPNMSPETVALIKAKYGYDQPVYIQYIRWLDGLINGNFGYSIVTHQSISADLAIRIPNTIKLILPAYLLAYALAIVLGLIAGSHKNKWVDKLIDGICAIGIALPTFWVSMLLIYFLGYKLNVGFPKAEQRQITDWPTTVQVRLRVNLSMLQAPKLSAACLTFSLTAAD